MLPPDTRLGLLYVKHKMENHHPYYISKTPLRAEGGRIFLDITVSNQYLDISGDHFRPRSTGLWSLEAYYITNRDFRELLHKDF